MSDFIDDPNVEAPTTPTPDTSLEPAAGAADSQHDSPVRTSAPSAAVFTSGFEAPGEPVAEPETPPSSGNPLAPNPFAVEMGQPAADEVSPMGQPVEAYRPSPPIERAVRPLEPAPWSHSLKNEEPTPPREARLPYYAKPQETKSSKPWPMALLALASGLLGALMVLGGLAIAGVFDEAEVPPTTTAAPVAITTPPEPVVIREVVPAEGAENVATAVGQKVVPSIVTVEVGTGDATGEFAAFGSGSGVVFTSDGLILTNHHVIEDAVVSRVIFQDGRIYEASIIGSDELTDLAVLQIEATGLTPIELGSTTDLQIGDRAIAVGNPLGLEGGASLTVGVVSAFDREVNTGDPTPLFGMLQTDAPITNGSSGGALVNSEGKLIGITTAIGVSEAGAEGIGFATPVELVRKIAEQIIETGDVAHAFLGVTLRTNFEIQPDGAAIPAGAVVAGFAEGESAAADAGLEVGDIVLEWNGNSVRKINDLISGIRGSSVGEEISLVVHRDGETMTFNVILGERPEGV